MEEKSKILGMMMKAWQGKLVGMERRKSNGKAYASLTVTDRVEIQPNKK